MHAKIYGFVVGDLNERIRVLKSANLTSLAYLTAATHGLNEEAEELKAVVTQGGKALPEVIPNPKFLKPPPPVQQAESNWPLLTVSRVSVTCNLLYSLPYLTAYPLK